MRREFSGYDRRQWEDYDPNDAPIQLHTDSYRRFSRGIDSQLARLEARWAHIAIRNAPRPPGAPLRKPKPK